MDPLVRWEMPRISKFFGNVLRVFRERLFTLIRRVSPSSQKKFLHPFSHVLKNNSRGIYWWIEQPAETIFDSSSLVVVAGWACAKAGIDKIDVYLDELFLQTIYPKLERPDVQKAYPSIADAASCGFFETIHLGAQPEGKYVLIFAIRDQNGNCAVAEHAIQLVDHSLLYHRYFLATLPTEQEVQAAKNILCKDADELPFFEWWIDVVDIDHLSETIQSLASQTYQEWCCNLVAPISQWPEIEAVVNRLTETFPISTKISLQETLAPDAAQIYSNHYLGFLTSGELLTPHALLSWAIALKLYRPELSYSDSDQIQAGGLHCKENFKPNWSPDYALSRDYIGGVYLAQKNKTTMDILRASRQQNDRDVWRYDLWLRLSEQYSSIYHSSNVLWSEPYKTSVNPLIVQQALEAVQSALDRRHLGAQVTSVGNGLTRKITWPIPQLLPLVSIVIPTTGRLELVGTCFESLRTLTTYLNYEIIFIDNSCGHHPEGIRYLHQQNVQVIEDSGPFNWSRLNNVGVAAAHGELLLFLNDDIEITDGNWLSELVAQALRPEVGTVGASLLYPDGRIQHGGVFLVEHGGACVHYLQFLNPQKQIYQNLHQTVREVSGNTGACLMVRQNVFSALGGFDEDYTIVGSDVDLCFRISQAGYRNIWTPFAQLIHHESVSRKNAPIDLDEFRLWQLWREFLESGDPFYSPNLTQNKTDCSLNELPHKLLAIAGSDFLLDSSEILGINLIGYIRAEMGIGEATRGLANALDIADIPFGVVDYQKFNPSRMGDDSWLSHSIEEPQHEVNVLPINADLIPAVVDDLPGHYFSNRYTIGYWVWELPEFPDEWLSSFNLVDEVWVPSKFVQEAVSRKSSVPVLCMPYVIDKQSTSYLERSFFQLPESRFLFLCMFDTNSISERKNPFGAIQAFRRAFAPNLDDVGLVIKINNANDETLQNLYGIIAEYENIYILDSTMSRYEVDSLTYCCDCFVSLHRAEGFGLVIAEAMALGRPVIVTHWSGNTDFTNSQNAVCISSELRRVGRDYGPYKAHQYWAEPNIDEAAQWMQRLASDRALAERLGKQAQGDIVQQFSPETVGQLIRQRLFCIRHHNSARWSKT